MPGGPDPNADAIGWYNYNSAGYLSKAVRGKLPNAWGLYDMSGNVLSGPGIGWIIILQAQSPTLPDLSKASPVPYGAAAWAVPPRTCDLPIV